MTTVSGKIAGCKTGAAISSPSTAESTDSAGVIMASP